MGDCCFICRTGNEKRGLIQKSVIQNRKIKTQVRKLANNVIIEYVKPLLKNEHVGEGGTLA